MRLFVPTNARDIETLCIYHRVDMDGKCSGAIINYIYTKVLEKRNIWFIGCNYEKDFDINQILQSFPNIREMYVVDYSLSPEDTIIVINKNISLIWCDHHKTAIEKYEQHPEFEYSSISTWDDPDIKEFKYKNNDNFLGVVSYKHSGASLTYIVLAPILVNSTIGNTEVGKGIVNNIATVATIVSTYDTWDHTNQTKWDIAYAFNNGTRLYNLYPVEDKWFEIFENVDTVMKIIHEGEIITKINDIQNKITADAYAGTLTWEGLNFCIINKLGNSNIVNSVFNPSIHDAVLLFMYSPKESLYKISMFSNDKLSEEQKEKLDLSTIALKYGGGGHRLACGFSCEELPFKVKDIKPILK